MIYGILKGNSLRIAPKMLLINEEEVWFPTDEQYLSEGYKPIILENPPIVNAGYHTTIIWYEEANEIKPQWNIQEDEEISESEYAEVGRILMGVKE